MMRVQVGDQRVGITFESLMWFLVFTAVGTVIGMVAYDYLPASWRNPLTGGATGTQPPTGGTK